MAYLKGPAGLKLTLRSDGAGVVQWWVDASYAVHHDARSHTGATLSLGQGSIFYKSSKQKLNTTSSTEAELVGVYDGMLEILWVKYFLESQGYVGMSRAFTLNNPPLLRALRRTNLKGQYQNNSRLNCNLILTKLPFPSYRQNSRVLLPRHSRISNSCQLRT